MTQETNTNIREIFKTVTKQGRQTIRSHNQAVILAAAEEEFVLQGFGGATMQSIADRSGLPKANVHYYFKSKKICIKLCCKLSSKSGMMDWLL